MMLLVPPTKRFVELDGVRGLAIALTIVCNTLVWGSPVEATGWATLANGSWVGVQLFFVLSGFLITGILIDAKDDPYYFRNFFARRALRILPVYFLVLGMLSVALWTRGRGLPHHPLCYWLFVSNFCIAGSGYWGDYLGVTWSLAVEEHFYFVWPVLVAFVPVRRLFGVTCLVMTASLLLRYGLAAAGVDPTAIYTITPTRIDGLAAGALIAIAVHREMAPAMLARSARWLMGAGTAIMAAVALKAGNFDYQNPLVETFGYAGLTMAAAGLVMWLVTERDAGDPLRRAMRWQPLVTLGFYSYAVYLYHPLVNSLLTRLAPFRAEALDRFPGGMIAAQMTITGLVAVLAFALAVASYWLFEKKFLDLRGHFRGGVPSLQQQPVR